MPYSAKAIANYFIDLARDDGRGVDPMKLLKLIYFAHGWKLALDGTPLINEPIEAWKYGPVVPSIYHFFKKYGSGNIRENATEWSTEEDGFVAYEPRVPNDDAYVRMFLDRVWSLYADMTGVQLSNLTHEPGSPWDLVWKTANGKQSVDIPDESIRVYFASQLNA